MHVTNQSSWISLAGNKNISCANRKWSWQFKTLEEMNVSNLANHPCSGKCTDFNEEQCSTCLIKQDAPHQNVELQTDEEKFLNRALSAQREIS